MGYEIYPKYKSTKVLQKSLSFYSLILFHIKILNTHLLNLLEQINIFCSFFYINNESVIRYAVKKNMKKVYI